MPKVDKNAPTHHVLVLSSDLKAGAEGYILTKPGKKYQIITAAGLKKIKDDDILYVSAHGYHSKDGRSALNEIKTTKQDMTPNEFYDYLLANKLPNVTMKMKIFACFSAGLTSSNKEIGKLKLDKSFAGQVSALLHETHNKITVYGYLEQLRFGPVFGDGHKSAGTRLDGTGEVRAKDKRYKFTPEGDIIGPDGMLLKAQRWQ